MNLGYESDIHRMRMSGYRRHSKRALAVGLSKARAIHLGESPQLLEKSSASKGQTYGFPSCLRPFNHLCDCSGD